MTIQSQVLAEILEVLGPLGVSEAAFGVAAVNDRRFMRNLRRGANMRLSTLVRAKAHLQTLRAEAGARAFALLRVADAGAPAYR